MDNNLNDLELQPPASAKQLKSDWKSNDFPWNVLYAIIETKAQLGGFEDWVLNRPGMPLPGGHDEARRHLREAWTADR